MQKRKAVVVVLSASLVAATLSLGPAAEAAGRTIKIGDARTTEGKVLLFPIVLSRASTKRITVDFFTVEGTADDTDDYVGRGGTIKFRPGTKRRTIAVATNTDASDEPPETVSVLLSSPRKASIGRGRATGTINDDDDPPSVDVWDTAVDEASGTLSFSATLSAPSGHVVTVDHATEDGTALAHEDYRPATGTLSFAPGETTRSVDVSVVDDTSEEPEEAMSVMLLGSTNASIGRGRATGTIADDDDPPPSIEIDDVSAAEGPQGMNGAFRFPVSLSGASNVAVTVDYVTEAVTAHNDDFAAASGRLTFLPGDTSEFAVVTVHGDDLDEEDETFAVTLAAPVNATIEDGTATGLILDDDPAPSVSVSDAPGENAGPLREGDGRRLSFVVTLSAASSRTITVPYDVVGGTATTDDFVPVSGELEFAPGATTRSVDVDVLDDAVDEEDTETVTVTLGQPSNATLGVARATGYITDDDDEPALSIADERVREGDSGTTPMTFTVTLSALSERAVSVRYETVQVEPHTSAPSDYGHTAGTLTFPPGTASATITVDIVGDTQPENEQRFELQLSDPLNATIADGRAIGKIDEDD